MSMKRLSENYLTRLIASLRPSSIGTRVSRDSGIEPAVCTPTNPIINQLFAKTMVKTAGSLR